MEEAAASKAQGIPPFEDSPFAILKNIFGNAVRRRRGELAREHPAYRLLAFQRFQSDLMINGMVGIQLGNAVNIGSI